MKKITTNMFAENPNVEAFVIFHGSFKPFYLSINKGAPIEKRIKSILKPDGYAWAEDIAYNCETIVVPQSKKAYDAFITYILSNPLWARRLINFNTQVLPYERSSFQEMKGGIYFCPDYNTGKGWMRSFTSFAFGAYYDDHYISLQFFGEEVPQEARLLMDIVEAACSHMSEDQEEKVKETFKIIYDIYGEGYGRNISEILG